MNITMRYCKPTLVTALVSLIISISALMEIQADEHGQTGSGILMLEPVTVPEYYRQLHVGDSEHILRYSTIVEDSEMRKIYSTPDGGLYIWIINENGRKYLTNVCRWIPWVCQVRPY